MEVGKWKKKVDTLEEVKEEESKENAKSEEEEIEAVFAVGEVVSPIKPQMMYHFDHYQNEKRIHMGMQEHSQYYLEGVNPLQAQDMRDAGENKRLEKQKKP